ncbi:retron system putative HNH endonuclease [uncultured Herbaspirillum sp.]|uniref:retron system putative HNH endonuclease n=1 Tax=uncultured Herbaspirillum sp. TaxID=160236 RepID=UPI00258B7B52|nr:retron system putative HNH endonuclease [uncultured Herbaspirillum sp.]
MRSIQKIGGGGYHLAQAHANPPQTHTQATTRWTSFGHKAAVRQSLQHEQYQLCCYSEIRADQLGHGYHIEHVENKSQNPVRTFDYTNLAASALDSTNDLGRFKQLGRATFGGHAPGKQASCDMARFVTCHQPDCARFFAYLSDGRIVPANNLTAADRDRAQYTIDLLNLNSPYLITLRQSWWDELDELYTQHQQQGWSLSHLVAIDLVPHQHALSPFFSMTRQFFGPVAETVLQQQAPSLL